MTSSPSISAIIAVRDGRDHLPGAIGSVLSQAYEPLETIVIDGASTDGSREIAASFEGVRCIDQDGLGLAGAWNQAVEASTGELIAFLDSDDRWLPGKLHAQVEALAADPGLTGVDGRVRFVLVDGAAAPPGFRMDLLEGDHPGHLPGTLLIRRTVFDEVGYFDPAYEVALDVDWFARVKDSGFEVETLDRLLLEKRFHESNLSHSRPDVYSREMIRALRDSAARQGPQAAG